MFAECTKSSKGECLMSDCTKTSKSEILLGVLKLIKVNVYWVYSN